MAAEQNTADQVKEETKIETKGQMTQRHKREVKVSNNAYIASFLFSELKI